jgi:CheY-like chemotaxis protein/MinD-like ATPase involved in chromosome partitioning or flagellar assembly
VAKILVVDDDRDLLKLVQTVLSRAGHTLTLAMDGQEALQVALANDFDLAVVDVMMPTMDGYELTRRLRADEHTRHLPVLILTARTQVADQMSAAEAGADGYLGKPLSYKELTEKVRQLIEAAAIHHPKPKPAEPPPEPSHVFALKPTPAVPSQPPAATPPVPAISSAVPPFAATAPTPTPPPSASAQGGRLIVTIGLRGGVGVTTVAVCLAGALLRSGRRVCLADLSPNGGQVAHQLHLQPTFTWGDWTTSPGSKVVGQTLIRHPSGLFVLAAPNQPMRRGLSGEAFQAALTVMRSFFTDVVVDAAPTLDDATCAALTAAQHIFIIFSPEAGAARTALSTCQALERLSIPATNIRLVLNQNSSESPLSIAETEAVLGRQADWAIPHDRTQTAALALQAPLVFNQPSTPLVAAVAALAMKL